MARKPSEGPGDEPKPKTAAKRGKAARASKTAKAAAKPSNVTASNPAPAHHRAGEALVSFHRATLTIAFDNEEELRDRLRELLALVEPPREVAVMTTADAVAMPAESCLTLFQAIDVVNRALHPQRLDPPEKLGETYLSSQERELFQARVVKEVGAQGCAIEAAHVPAGVDTTHANVITAVREKARR